MRINLMKLSRPGTFSTTVVHRTLHLSSQFYPAPSLSQQPKLEYPLIILHGLYGSKQNFQSISKRLQSLVNMDVICVDARNHGNSMHADSMTYQDQATDMQSIYEQYKIEKANLLGHSMGGKTAMCVALEDVDAVNRLIVVDIAPTESPSMETVASYNTALLQADLHGDTVAAVRKRLMKELAVDVPDESVRMFLLTNLKQTEANARGVEWRCNVAAFNAAMDDITNFPLYHNFFGGPALFIAGGKSDYINEDSEKEIRRLFRDVKIKTINDAGHWVHADKPAEFCQIVADFLLDDKH